MVEISLKKGIEIIKSQVKLMPASAGVYKMLGSNGNALYVGKAKNLPKRVISYSRYEALTNRLRNMVALLDKIEFITTNTEAEALLLEANLIKSLKPIYNISLRDDKSFPYILIEENHPYPRITKYRGKKTIKGSYFGPFASAGSIKQTITELQKIFLIRPCSNSFFASRTKPCLQWQIKRCSAPCVKKISEADYRRSIEQTKEFLSGKSSKIQQDLSHLMEEASNNLEFEKAAYIRDRIKILTSMQAKNSISDIGVGDADIIAIYKNNTGQSCIQIFFIRGGINYGNKVYFQDNISEIAEEEIISTFIGLFYQNKAIPKEIYLNKIPNDHDMIAKALSQLSKHKVTLSIPKLGAKLDLINFAFNNAKQSLEKMRKEQLKHTTELETLTKLFNLDKTPSRIEIYDNSHIQGSNAIGCMVVFTNNGFEKSSYRKFNIRETKVGDDYQMLREVLMRRMKKLDDSNYPDLLLIDGGKGHLSTAYQVLEELDINNIPIVCIAKGADRNAGREFFHLKDKQPFQLPIHNPTLHFLQTLRDEVHRYAIQSHRGKRIRGLRQSIINDIPGIGLKRKKLLLQHFGSPDAIINASIDDLKRVRGISLLSAKRIYSYLHNVH